MDDQPHRLTSFFEQLRNRRVYRVAIVYLGAAFALLEASDIIFPRLGLPDWTVTLVLAILAIGFPLAVILAWIFQITPEGIRRSPESGEVQTSKQKPLTSNLVIAVLVIIIIGLLSFSIFRKAPENGRAKTDPESLSIAVLPLDNHTGSEEELYFVDGMHEAIINHLHRLSDLKVISRTSVMGYRDTDMRLPEIAQELDVSLLIEGSVLKAGNEVRITAQLIDGHSDEHIWSNDYDGELTNILSLQKSVAGAIAKEIGLALSPAEQDYLADVPKINPEAYKLYLKGWHFRMQESDEGMLQAVKALEQAVKIDSNYALAWAALAHSYLMMFWHSEWEWDEALDRMKIAVERALAIDPRLSDAHTAHGLHQFFSEEDLQLAERSFLTALELEPHNLYAQYEYAWFQLRMGRPLTALELFRKLESYDPLSPPLLNALGLTLLSTRQYEEAIAYLGSTLELAPDHRLANNYLTESKLRLLLKQERYQEAADSAVLWSHTYLEIIARMKLPDDHRGASRLDSLKQVWRSHLEVSDWKRGWLEFYSVFGDTAKAIAMLDSIQSTHVVTNPNDILLYEEFDFLRSTDEYADFNKRMGIEPIFDAEGNRVPYP